jgi:hypothetical protein
MDSLSPETEDAMITCALRFDGYGYADRRGDDELLAALADRFVETLTMSEDQAENHAAFFCLQRFLFKWGGENLPPTSPEHVAFLLLFLHLYRAEVEPLLRLEEYWERWRVRYEERAERFAAEVRSAIRSREIAPNPP